MISLMIVLTYLFGTGLIAYCINKRNKIGQTTDEMFVANRSLPVYMVVPLLFGELIAGSSTVGAAGSAYSAGLAGGWGNWGNSLGCLLFAFVFLKFFTGIKGTGAMTGPEAFEIRFDRKIKILVLIFTIIPLLIILAAQLTASAVLLAPMTGLSVQSVTLLVSLCFIVMALAGIRGIAGMNILHSIVLFFGMIIVASLCVKYAGGLKTVTEAVPKSFFNPFSAGFTTVLAQAVGACLGFSTSVTPINTCYSAKNAQVVFKSMIIVACLTVFFSIFPLLIGMSGVVVIKGVAQPDAILFLMSDRVSPVLSGVATMAEFAALFSTAPFFLLSITTLIIRDLYLPFAPEKDEKQLIIMTRILMIIIMFFVVYLSGRTTSVLSELLSAGQIKATAAIVLLLGIYWKRLTNQAAFWGLTVGGTLATIWHFIGRPWEIEPLWPAMVSSLAIMTLMSLAQKEKVSKDFVSYEKKLAAAEAQKNIHN